MVKKIAVILGIVLIGFAGIVKAQKWRSITDHVKIFEEGYIQVIGASEEGQSRYKAIRSAKVVAYRELLEVLQGLYLYGETTVRDGMLESDIIRTRVQGFLRGAIECGKKYYPHRGYAEVCLRLYIKGKGGMYDIMLPLLKGKEKGALISLPEYTPKNILEEMPEVAAPSQLKEVYDGLIVDVRGYNFRPALVNRIITEHHQLVFGPSKVLNDILIERGCGGFTTDLNKAKALLASWGSKNPMIIKPIGVHNFTDVKVSSDTAAAIYVHDQKTNFLSQAKVVFVLR